MGRINLPYQFRDGSKAYAAQIMADLNALAGGLNDIHIEGLPSSDLENILRELKGQIEGKIDAFQPGNAAQIKFSDGLTIQEKLDNGDLNGADGVLNNSEGLYCFYVGGDGHLYLMTRSQEQAQAFSIDERGHLLYTLGEPGSNDGDISCYDLGNVRGPQGEGGDMLASSYDPSGKRQDIFAYADAAAAAVSHSSSKSCFAYAAGWDEDKQNLVSLAGLKAADNFLVCHSSSATDEQRQAWREGSISVVAQEAGGFTLQADQVIPLVDIPLSVIILP